MRTLRPLLPAFLAVVALAAVPLVVQDSYIRHLMIMAFIFAVVASNWDLSMGYGGVFNFGHMAFFGIGVYTFAILGRVLDVSPWLALPASGLAAAVAAALVTLPVLRLKGIYVILVTFAFGQLCLQIVVSQSEVTGGTQGMVLLPPLRIGDYNFARDGRFAYYYAGLLLLIASTVYLRGLVRSDFGRSVVALRDNQDYAVSRGLSLSRQRLLLMMGSAVFTGLAGGFYATYLRVASVEVFGFSLLALVLSMLLLGGICTLYGPILAAFALTLLSESLADLGAWRFLIIATGIILVMRFYPGGLWSAVTRLAGR